MIDDYIPFYELAGLSEDEYDEVTNSLNVASGITDITSEIVEMIKSRYAGDGKNTFAAGMIIGFSIGFGMRRIDAKKEDDHPYTNLN